MRPSRQRRVSSLRCQRGRDKWERDKKGARERRRKTDRQRDREREKKGKQKEKGGCKVKQEGKKYIPRIVRRISEQEDANVS